MIVTLLIARHPPITCNLSPLSYAYCLNLFLLNPSLFTSLTPFFSSDLFSWSLAIFYIILVLALIGYQLSNLLCFLIFTAYCCSKSSTLIFFFMLCIPLKVFLSTYLKLLVSFFSYVTQLYYSLGCHFIKLSRIQTIAC